jgi:hypothetical protein
MILESEGFLNLGINCSNTWNLVINQTVYLLGIGDKDSQKQDIETCRSKVKQIKKEV